MLPGEVGVRRAGDADDRPSRPEDPERLGERFSALGIQDDVVVVDERLEVLGSVVDDDVGTEVADPFDVAGAGRRGDRRAQVLGQLDRVRADAPRAAVDEHLLAGLEVRSLDERLPRGQRDERHRGRLGHGEAYGLIARSSSSTAMRSAKVPMRPSRTRA